ncbi:MAG: hypothetical protein AAGJ87_12460 [Pseudomonadota bacterium]
MKRFAIAAVVSASVASPAFAADVEEACKAYAAANDGDPSGCACLANKAAADASLAEAILAIKEPADLEAADEATLAAIGACYPIDDGDGCVEDCFPSGEA